MARWWRKTWNLSFSLPTQVCLVSHCSAFKRTKCAHHRCPKGSTNLVCPSKGNLQDGLQFGLQFPRLMVKIKMRKQKELVRSNRIESIRERQIPLQPHFHHSPNIKLRRPTHAYSETLEDMCRSKPFHAVKIDFHNRCWGETQTLKEPQTLHGIRSRRQPSRFTTRGRREPPQSWPRRRGQRPHPQPSLP